MDISRGIKTRRGGISILVVNMKVLVELPKGVPELNCKNV